MALATLLTDVTRTHWNHVFMTRQDCETNDSVVRRVRHDWQVQDQATDDFDKLRPLPQEVARDLPGDGWRRVQRAEGYRYALVNGECTIENKLPTNARPGQLLRHGHAPV